MSEISPLILIGYFGLGILQQFYSLYCASTDLILLPTNTHTVLLQMWQCVTVPQCQLRKT